MKKLQLTLATALLLGLSTAFAGTPKTDAKTDAKTSAKVESDAPSKTDAKDQGTLTTYTYYVTGISGSNYMVSSNPEHEERCGSGEELPCRFTSTNSSLDGTLVPKTEIDNGGGADNIVVIEHQDPFN